MTEPAGPDGRDPGTPGAGDDAPSGESQPPVGRGPGRLSADPPARVAALRAARPAATPARRPGTPGTPGAAGGSGDPGEPPDAAPVRRPPNLVGIVIVATALLVAVLVTTGIFLPALGELGKLGSHDPNALPASLSVCSRTYRLAEGSPARTHDEIVERDGQEPVVVSTGPFIGCPDGMRPDGPAGALVTVIYVRTAEDAYRAYELAGGP